MRRDIQLLRAVAVLLVVVYHADLGIFHHGYLGVDVFFVISGFLITGVILRELHSGEFSFSRFYLRRAKRLLPALYSTLAFTSLLAFWLLTPEQKTEFLYQFVGAITFSANFVLPTQIDYFAEAAANKPLLHIWSLSLEEQYYFLLPLLLFLVPRRWQFTALSLGFFASIVWCIDWASNTGRPPLLWRFDDALINEWAFFLFPTRAWELLAGSICAWIMLRHESLKIPSALKWLGLLTIIVVSLEGPDSVHPRGNAIITVLATTLLVLGDDTWLPNHLFFRGLERIGDWSYSVYLVHWPLFAFAYVVYVEQVPTPVNSVIILISLSLGFLQYKYVETPLRHKWNRPAREVWQRVAVASVALFSVPVAIATVSETRSANHSHIIEARRINQGLSEECDGSFEGTSLKAICSQGLAPTIAVWGDSYAMHLVPGLRVSNINLVQLTKSACGPFINLAPVTRKFNEAWAKVCVEHNKKALEYILKNDTIKYVVLGSAFAQYFSDKAPGEFLLDGRVTRKDRKAAIENFSLTIRSLKDAGKIPIIVSPPPRSGFNAGACLEREDRRLTILRSDCTIPIRDYQQFDPSMDQALIEIAEKSSVRILALRDLLCDNKHCKTRVDGKYAYRDAGHLAVEGSIALLGSISIDHLFPTPPDELLRGQR